MKIVIFLALSISAGLIAGERPQKRPNFARAGFDVDETTYRALGSIQRSQEQVSDSEESENKPRRSTRPSSRVRFTVLRNDDVNVRTLLRARARAIAVATVITTLTVQPDLSSDNES